MDRPLVGGGAPEITPTPSYYSDFQPPPPGFELERLVTRKPVAPSQGKQQYSQINPVPETWQSLEEDRGFQWLPGVWTHVPIPGLLAILASLICIAGTVAVLVKSDGMPVTHWTLSPTVYIALMTTGTNMFLRYAFHEGNKIAWWYKALQGGTVRDLHNRWASGDGFWGALGAGRHFNLVSLACLATTVIVIDQPLIQRASTIVPATFISPVNITATIAPEIPFGYTFSQLGRGVTQGVMTQPMIAAFNDYNTQVPMTTGFTGCRDSCTGMVDAGGLAAECSTVTGPIAYLVDPKTDAQNNIFSSAYLAQSPFNVSFALVPAGGKNASYIRMVVSYTTNGSMRNCAGTMTQRTCKLRSATLRYPVSLNQTVLTLGNITQDAVVQSFQPAPNNTIMIDGGSDYDMYTIGGLYMAAINLFQANATYSWIGALGTMMTLPDTLSNQFIQSPIGNNTLQGLGQPLVCSSNWTDPTNHILTALNQIAFRVSLNAAGFPYRNLSTAPAPQVATMIETRAVNVYKSVYKYLAASTVLTVICVALVLPTFLGWWELGRNVSLNPIATAKAFDAPMFNGLGSNAPLHELVNTMGARPVKYGEVEGLTRRQLKLADPQTVVRPMPGAVYQ